MRHLLAIVAAAILAPTALAQIAQPPAALAKKLRATLNGDTFRVGRGQVRVRTLDGLLYTLDYTGPAGSESDAARALAAAVDRADAAASLTPSLEKVTAEIKGKGPIDTRFLTAYQLKIEAGRDLRLRVAPVEVNEREFGADTHVIGKRGPIIREFSDFQCPYCKQLATQTLPKVKAAYVNAGRARFSYRHLPLTSIHPYAAPAAAASECAARQGRFWPYHDALFRRGPEDLDAAAISAGLDLKSFRACVQAGQGRAPVNADAAIAEKLGLSGTPTVFVGPFLLPNAYDAASYEPYIRMAAAKR